MQTDLVKAVLRSAKRISVAVLIVAALLYLSACTLMYFKQRSLLYFPTPESRVDESASISVETGGQTLRILTKSADGPDAVIYFGGNSEDVAFSIKSFSKALPIQNLFMVNYRGYGGSTGSPSEEALFSDALAVYDLVHEKYPNISVVGRSLGTGVAVYLASVRKVERLVLITPYDSIENVASKHFPFFPISLLLKDKFDSASRVPRVTAKTLVILAESDEVIPRGNSDALIAQFPSDQVVVKVIQGANHNSIEFSPEYFELIRMFL
jgi:pimeloyl-ACP methyl ester carboxylesterase